MLARVDNNLLYLSQTPPQIKGRLFAGVGLEHESMKREYFKRIGRCHEIVAVRAAVKGGIHG